jgi:hypothetical protein
LNRKLLLLNLVLLGAAVVIGMRVHDRWIAARVRDEMMLRQVAKPQPGAPFTPPPGQEPVQPVTYADIAQKTLFSKDRNPDVVVEKPAPPPPKPMPALPVLFGVMNIDGPSAILAEKADASPREYKPGEAIGPFKLVAVNEQAIVFEWENKRVERRVDELARRPESPSSDGSRSQGGGGQAAPAAAPPPPPQPPARPEPGVDVGGGVRACQPGDTSPAGTVSGGMRKVVTPSPFGNVCRWEPAGR